MKTLVVLLILVSCGHRLRDANYRQTHDPIRGKLLDQIYRFEECYNQQDFDERLASESKLTFTISKHGKVENPKVTEVTNTPPKMQACLIDVVKRIDFPSPTQGRPIDLEQPLKFTPRK